MGQREVTGLRGAIDIQVRKAQANLKSFAQTAKTTATTWAKTTAGIVKGQADVGKASGDMSRKASMAKRGFTVLQKAATSLRQNLDQLKNKAREVGQQVGATFSAMSRSATRVVAVTAGAVTGITGALVKVGFSANTMADKAKLAFTTLIGDGQRAVEFFKELQDFAARTPFQIGALVSQATKLLAQGFESSEIIPMLEKIGDAVAAIGGNDQTIERVTLALTQMKATGRVSAEEMRQLAEAGIPAWQMLADAAGMSVGEIRKLAENGAVEADGAIAAILAGMEQRFGGMMAKTAGSWHQSLSTILDNVRQFAGRVTRPLFDAMTQLSNIMLATMGSPRFAQMAENVQAAFGRLAETVFGTGSAFLQSGSMIDMLETVLVSSIDAVRAGVLAFQELWPQIQEAATTIAELIRQVGGFLLEHPQLMTALVALKVAGFLGITDVLKTLLPLLQSLGSGLASLGGQMSGSAMAAVGLKAALAALVAYGAFKFTQWLTGATQDLEDFKRAMEEAQELDKTVEQKRVAREQKADVAGLDNEGMSAGRRAGVAGERLQQIDRELAGVESSIEGSMQNLKRQKEEAGRLGEIFGNKLVEELEAEVAALQRRKAELEERRTGLSSIQGQLQAQAKADMAAMMGGGEGAAPAAGGAGGGFITDTAAAKTAKAAAAKEEAAKKAEERKQAAAMAAAARALEQRIAHGTRSMTGLAGSGQRALDAGVSKAALNPLADRATAATAEFKAGGSKLAFDTVIKDVGAKMNALTQASLHFGGMMQQLGQVLPQEAVDGLNAKFEQLQQQLANGEMNLDQFKQSVAELGQEAQQADLKRKASGQFTQQEFQQALLQRAAAIQQQRMQQAVNTKLQQMGLIAEDVGGQFKGVGSDIEKFGGQMVGAMKGGAEFTQQQAENLQKFGAFLNSQQGAATMLYNNIQLLSQQLTLGVADTYREQRAILQQIEAMNGQLIALTRPQTPVLRPTEADFLRDPALQGGGGITVNFPNVAVDGPRVASQLFDAIEKEGRRRGRVGV